MDGTKEGCKICPELDGKRALKNKVELGKRDRLAQRTGVIHPMPPVVGGSSIIVEVQLFPYNRPSGLAGEGVVYRPPHRGPVDGDVEALNPFGRGVMITVDLCFEHLLVEESLRSFMKRDG